MGGCMWSRRESHGSCVLLFGHYPESGSDPCAPPTHTQCVWGGEGIRLPLGRGRWGHEDASLEVRLGNRDTRQSQHGSRPTPLPSPSVGDGGIAYQGLTGTKAGRGGVGSRLLRKTLGGSGWDPPKGSRRYPPPGGVPGTQKRGSIIFTQKKTNKNISGRGFGASPRPTPPSSRGFFGSDKTAAILRNRES